MKLKVSLVIIDCGLKTSPNTQETQVSTGSPWRNVEKEEKTPLEIYIKNAKLATVWKKTPKRCQERVKKNAKMAAGRRKKLAIAHRAMR